MQQRILNLKLLNREFGIVRLKSSEKIPEWAIINDIYSITRTETELTIVCPSNRIPKNFQSDIGWKCLKVEGSFDLNEIGIIASISNTLSQNGISIYVFSSYDTDFILIKDNNIEKAIKSLRSKGHSVLY